MWCTGIIIWEWYLANILLPICERYTKVKRLFINGIADRFAAWVQRHKSRFYYFRKGAFGLGRGQESLVELSRMMHVFFFGLFLEFFCSRLGIVSLLDSHGHSFSCVGWPARFLTRPLVLGISINKKFYCFEKKKEKAVYPSL